MAGNSSWQLAFLEGLLRASWQASLLILFALAAQRLCRRALAPRWRYSLWLLVLARLALPVSFSSVLSVFNYLPDVRMVRTAQPDVSPRPLDLSPPAPDLPTAATGASPPEVAPPAATSAPRIVPPRRAGLTARFILPLLFPLWIVGAGALVLRVLWLNFRLAAKLRRKQPVSDLGVLELARECRREVGVRNMPWILETAEVRSPALFGISVPRLLLPERMLDSFSPQELRFIVLHELMHFRSRDIVLNWMATLVQILHWFNPLVWLAMARLHSDRELARDAQVLAHLAPEDATAYGGTIVRLLDGFAQTVRLPGLAGILEDRHEMKRRIAMILSYRGNARSWRWAPIPALALLAAVTLTDAQVSRTLGEGVDTRQKVLVLVTDAETGAAIAGATLNRTERTNAAGAGTISTSVPGVLTVRVEGYVPRIVRLNDDDVLGGEYAISLQRGLTIGGTVVDTAGRPVAGATVTLPWLTASEGFTAGRAEREDVLVRTGSDGRWSCSEVPRNRGIVHIILSHPQHGSAVYSCYPSSIIPIASSDEAPIVAWNELRDGRAILAMLPPIPVRGQVLDAQWNPVAGAQLRLRSPFSPLYSQSLQGVAGPDGRFEFRNGSAGVAVLTAWAPGYVLRNKQVKVDGGLQEITLALERGMTLRGRVLDQAGQPVAGAVLRDSMSQSEFCFTAKTDANGRFEWDSAPPKPFAVSINAPGFTPSNELVQAGDTENVLRIRRLRRIEVTGRVVDAATREPIPQFEVLDSSSRVPMGRYYGFRHKAFGRDGRFIIYFDDSVRPWGTVVQSDATGDRVLHYVFGLKIKADGYVPDETKAVAIENGDVSLEVALEKARVIEGIVRLPDGAPLQGAELRIYSPDDRPVFDADGRFRSLFDEVAAQKTDAAGRARLLAGPENGTVVVTHPAGMARTNTDRLAKDPVIVLELWASIGGRVWIGDSPAAGQSLILTAGLSPGLTARFAAETDKAGRYRFEHVPAGIYTLTWSALLITGVSLPRQQLEVAVESAEDLSLDLRSLGMPVVGRLVNSVVVGPANWDRSMVRLDRKEKASAEPEFADEQSRRAWIRARLATDEGRRSLQRWMLRAMVDKDGTFRIEDVAPGTYVLTVVSASSAKDRGFSRNVREVAVPMPTSGAIRPLDLGTVLVR